MALYCKRHSRPKPVLSFIYHFLSLFETLKFFTKTLFTTSENGQKNMGNFKFWMLSKMIRLLIDLVIFMRALELQGCCITYIPYFKSVICDCLEPLNSRKCYFTNNLISRVYFLFGVTVCLRSKENGKRYILKTIRST